MFVLADEKWEKNLYIQWKYYCVTDNHRSTNVRFIVETVLAIQNYIIVILSFGLPSVDHC